MHAVCVAGVAHTNPAAHCVCVSEFAGQNIPCAHPWHTVLAVELHAAVWYVPAAHTAHVSGWVAPPAQKDPAGQATKPLAAEEKNWPGVDEADMQALEPAGE